MKNLDLILDLLTYEGPHSTDPADSIRVKSKIQETEITDVTRQQISIANAVIDQTINLSASSSDYLFILADQDISIKLNGISTAIALKTRAAGKRTLMFYARGPISGLTISNASGTSVNADIISINK